MLFDFDISRDNQRSTDGYAYVRMVLFYAEFVKFDGIYGQGALNHVLVLF